MEKKEKKRSTRTDGYQPTTPSKYGYQPRSPIAGYKPSKPDDRPNPPTTETDVTSDKK